MLYMSSLYCIYISGLYAWGRNRSLITNVETFMISIYHKERALLNSIAFKNDTFANAFLVTAKRLESIMFIE